MFLDVTVYFTIVTTVALIKNTYDAVSAKGKIMLYEIIAHLNIKKPRDKSFTHNKCDVSSVL